MQQAISIFKKKNRKIKNKWTKQMAANDSFFLNKKNVENVSENTIYFISFTVPSLKFTLLSK